MPNLIHNLPDTVKDLIVLTVSVDHEYATFYVKTYEHNDPAGGGVRHGASWVATSSYGEFAHYWSHMGMPFVDFVSKIGEDYLMSKIGHRCFDKKKVIKEINRMIFTARATTDQKAAAARDVKRIDDEYEGETVATMLWESIPISKCNVCWDDFETQDYDQASKQFVKKIWPAFIKELKQFNPKELTPS